MESALKHMFYYSLSKIITELTATVLNWNTKKNFKGIKIGLLTIKVLIDEINL